MIPYLIHLYYFLNLNFNLIQNLFKFFFKFQFNVSIHMNYDDYVIKFINWFKVDMNFMYRLKILDNL